MKTKLSRRFFLAGTGCALPLPLLPSLSKAADTEPRKRFVAWFTPNGNHLESFLPASVGRNYPLSPSLQPLGDHGVQQHVSVVSGLQRYDASFPTAGAHGFMTPAFLTCTQVSATGARASSLSADQIAAPLIRCPDDRFESLRLGLGTSEPADGHTPYSRTYLHAISYSPDPMLPQESPQQVFDSFMVGSNANMSEQESLRRAASKKSVLDFALRRLDTLQTRLSREDQLRLEAYTDEVRAMERSIEGLQDDPGVSCQGTRPTNLQGYQRLADIWIDLQVLALQCGLTNTITFMMAPGGSHRNYVHLGANGGHHNDYSHRVAGDWAAQLAKIERWQVEQYAKFLKRLDVMEADGTTILDKSTVIYGSELSNGAAHTWNQFPLLLGGGRSLGFTHVGEHQAQPEAPVARVLLGILQGLGTGVRSFAHNSSPIML